MTVLALTFPAPCPPLNSNDRLNRYLRARAEVATPGPWEAMTYDSGLSFRCLNASVITQEMGDHIADVDYDGGAEGPHAEEGADAEHIASWHPVVALAVAAWLDTEAAHVGSHDCEAHCEPDGCPQVLAALAVARVYLGESV